MTAPPALTAGGARLRGSLPRGVEPRLPGNAPLKRLGLASLNDALRFTRAADLDASGCDVALERAERPPLAHKPKR